MKILITGALGHIGSRVIREIPKVFPHHEIIMIDNMLTQRYCSLFELPTGGNYRFIEADVLELDLAPFVSEADVVLHLAAITDAASSFKNREEVERVNYNATIKVAEVCSQAKCPMLHISSTSVYGTQSEIVDEDCSQDELQPQSPYAETKLKEERFLESYGASGKLDFVICRFGTICGVSQGMRFHTAVNKFCWQAVMQQPLTLWRTALHQKRPYLVLDDAIRAINFIIKNSLFDRRIYNVLTDNHTVDDIIRFIRQHIPEFDIEYVDTEIMNQLSYVVSNQSFHELGFEFEGSVEKGISETIKLIEGSRSFFHMIRNNE
jgi:nucleoside-diphosphate-sugar epimerase